MRDEVKVYHSGSKSDSYTFCALVLRENGSFEFYCNFNLVSTSEKGQICERIECDDDGFLLLMWGETREERILKEIYFSWGNLVSTTVAHTFASFDLRLYRYSSEKEKLKAERRTENKIEHEFCSAHHRRIS